MFINYWDGLYIVVGVWFVWNIGSGDNVFSDGLLLLITFTYISFTPEIIKDYTIIYCQIKWLISLFVCSW